MLDIVYINDEHKSFLTDKLNFYNIQNCSFVTIQESTNPSILFIKTNFNLDNCLFSNNLPIQENLIEVLVNKKNIKIVFFNETEPDNYDVIKHIKPILLKLGIEENRLVVINNNEELIRFSIDSKIDVYVNHPHIYAGAKEMVKVEYDFNDVKKYNFMSYNRNLKAHRFFFLCLLKKHELLDSFDWSWLRGDEMGKFGKLPDWFYDKIMSKDDFNSLEVEIDFIIQNGRKISEYEYDLLKDTNTDKFDYPNHYSLNPYQNSYIHVVNESYYEDSEAILLSEKSIIPMYFSQLPLYLSSHNHLKYFRKKYGFDLFDDFINHDYDSEKNNFKRMNLLLEEIKRINNNKNDIKKFYSSAKKRFENNKNLVHEIVNEFEDSKFIKNLINE